MACSMTPARIATRSPSSSARTWRRASGALFTPLPAPPGGEAVALGGDAFTRGWRRGAAFSDLPTTSPAMIRRIHAAFQEKGVHVLDAPVSGGPIGAKTHRLAIWVGGDRGIYDAQKDVLGAMGDQHYYVGAIGAGAVAKLVHNCSSF